MTKPIVKFERLMETYLSFVPNGWASFRKALPLWLSEKLHLPKIIKKELEWEGKVLFTGHHESHCASAFFLPPLKKPRSCALTGWENGPRQAGELGEEIGQKLRKRSRSHIHWDSFISPLLIIQV